MNFEITSKPLPAADAVAHVIRAYHPMVKLPESVNELRALYLSVLHEQKALLLMDNARDEQQVEPLIPPPGCLLMVTSRFHFTVPGLKVKHLDALLPEDAIKLLLEIAPRIGDQAAEIAQLCGSLPLGLRLAASFLSTRANFKIAEYVRKLGDASERLKLIDASLSLSYELLREELQANWRTLSVFPDSFDQRAAAAVWDLDEEQTQERLGDLLNFSLVEWSEEAERYSLHDLAHVFADSRLSEAERLTHQQRHAEHFLQVLRQADRLYYQGGEAIKVGLSLFDREWNNALAAWEWAKDHAGASLHALGLCNEYPDATTNIAEIRQHPREQIIWRGAALAASRKLGQKKAQSWHLTNLGTAYGDLGDILHAIEFFEQALAITREIGGRVAQGPILNNLGLAYAKLGEPKLAIENYEQALVIYREVGDYRNVGLTLNNLGYVYMDLREIPRALEFFEQSLAILREFGDRRGEGVIINNLGEAYARLGEIERPLNFYEQARAIFREIGDRGGQGATLWNSALVLNVLGDRTQAISMAEAALVIYEQIEAPDASDVREQLKKWRSG